jgi:perosamine synthetase
MQSRADEPCLSTTFVPALPALPPALLLRPKRRQPTFPFDEVTARASHWFYMARAGVYHAVRHLAKGGVALMPSYHHGVEVEAARKAGARIRFYRIDESMQIDLQDLDHKMRQGNVRLVYVIYYVGFPHPIQDIAAMCRDRGLALFEDCALALFSKLADGESLGSFGDASVFCLYKSLPVPHGGILRGTLPIPRLPAPPIHATLHHAAGLALTHFEVAYGRPGRAVRHMARRLTRSALSRRDHVPLGRDHLEERDLSFGASRLVQALSNRFDAESIIHRRRHNFRLLSRAMADVAPVVFPQLPPGVCPLFVPLRVPKKARVVRALERLGVHAVNFWSLGDPACSPNDFPEVARLRREVIEVPCHQSLDDHAIERLARVLKHVIRNV